MYRRVEQWASGDNDKYEFESDRAVDEDDNNVTYVRSKMYGLN